MIPLVLFSRPRPLCHLLRCNHQNPLYLETVILKLPDCGQCGYGFPESLTHIQKKPQLFDLNDLVDTVLLIGMWSEYHRASPPPFSASYWSYLQSMALLTSVYPQSSKN